MRANKEKQQEYQQSRSRLQKKIAAAKSALESHRCPKCCGAVQLEDTTNYSNDKCWRPLPGTKAANYPLFYVACKRFCWKGPASTDPQEAVKDWNQVIGGNSAE